MMVICISSQSWVVDRKKYHCSLIIMVSFNFYELQIFKRDYLPIGRRWQTLNSKIWVKQDKEKDCIYKIQVKLISSGIKKFNWSYQRLL